VGQGPAGPGLVSTYETWSKNLRAVDFELVWVDGVLTQIVYEDGKRKEFAYGPEGELISITLYDEFDVVMGVKTLNYVANELDHVAYT
jgi:hypothetical protein